MFNRTIATQSAQARSPSTSSDSSTEMNALDCLQEFQPNVVSALRYGGWNPGDLSVEEIQDRISQNRLNCYRPMARFVPTYGLTPLCRAMIQHRVPLFEMLIKSGADVNARNQDGNIPLAFAIEHACSFVPRLLSHPQIDVNQLDGLGFPPIMVALELNPDVNGIALYI